MPAGQQFVNSYAPTFYVQMGLGDKAFTYQTVMLGMVSVGCLITMFILDRVGRRKVLIVGCSFQVFFMLLVAGLGTKRHKTTSSVKGVVAGVIFFYVFEKLSLSLNAYVVAAEIGGAMRKKSVWFGLARVSDKSPVLASATFLDVIASFVCTFSVPYLLAAPGTPGVNIGAKLGWIFGGISFAAFLFVVLYVPELSGRSLEETDELFEMKLWAWQFEQAQTTGVGRRIAEIEMGESVDGVFKARNETLVENVDGMVSFCSLDVIKLIAYSYTSRLIQHSFDLRHFVNGLGIIALISNATDVKVDPTDGEPGSVTARTDNLLQFSFSCLPSNARTNGQCVLSRKL